MTTRVQIVEMDSNFFRPERISTIDSVIAESIQWSCDCPWAARNELAKEKIVGHGYMEVLAVEYSRIKEMLESGYVMADPVTFCEFIRIKGWAFHFLNGRIRTGTFWKDKVLVGFVTRRGSRIDFEEFTTAESLDIAIMMRSPE